MAYKCPLLVRLTDNYRGYKKWLQDLKKNEANVEEPILALSCDSKQQQQKSSGSIEVF